MRRLIIADVFRVLRKPSIYVWFGIYLFLFVFDPSSNPTDFDEMYNGLQMTYNYIWPFMMGIPVFMAVYADEFKAGAMQTAIGRGLSRKKIIFAKYLDCVILALLLSIVEAISEIIVMRSHMLSVSQLQMVRFLVSALASCLKTIGAMSFASVFVFLTLNASLGLIVLMLVMAFAESILQWVQTALHIPVLTYSYMGQADSFCNGLAQGEGWIMPLLVFIAYMIVFNILGVAVFRRKELEL